MMDDGSIDDDDSDYDNEDVGIIVVTVITRQRLRAPCNSGQIGINVR
jgi:hypothetical protein